MNIVKGLSLQGFKLNVNQNFNSIPGLLHWLDSRRGVKTRTLSGQTYVTAWESLVQGRTATPSLTSRQPYFTDAAHGVDFDCTTRGGAADIGFRGGNLEPYRALWLRPCKFGVYLIAKRMADSTVRLFQVSLSLTGGNENFIFSSGLKSGGLYGWHFNHRVNGSSTASSGNASSNIENQVASWAMLVDGSKHQQRINNSLILDATNYVTAVPGVTPLEVINFVHLMGNTGRMIIYVSLCYNWTGYTSEQITQFDADVRGLLESEKSNFL